MCVIAGASTAPETSASAASSHLLPGVSPRLPTMSCFLSAPSPLRPVGRILTSFHCYQLVSCKVQ